MNLLFPQWQGSGKDNVLFHGAGKLRKYLEELHFNEIPVPEKSELCVENNILGYEAIVSQLKSCVSLLKKDTPDSLLVIGGDCGVEPAPVTYMNRLLDGDLALVWFDAHGDLNTPGTSPSGHYHGMPLRTILGAGDQTIIQTCFSTLTPEQVILAGAREFDPFEKQYVTDKKIPVFSCHKLNKEISTIADLILKKGFRHVYIHIDMDVLDPENYSNIKHPTAGGLHIDTLIAHLRELSKQFTVAGLGIVEFVPDKDSGLLEIKRIIRTISKGRFI